MIARIRRPLALLLAAVLAISLPVVGASAASAAPGSTLSDLTLSTGAFDAPFTPTTTTSTATVPYAVTSLTFTPTASDPTHTIEVWNGDATLAVASGAPVAATLRLGTNILTVTVTDPSTTASTQYVIMVTREQPPAPAYDPRLASLSVSTGTLSPAFLPATTSYSVEVPYTTNSITVFATSTDAITITNPSRPMTGGTTALQVGGNLVQVTVTAVDGTTTTTYNVSIVRGDAPTADVDLDALSISAGTLTPAFDPAVTSYTATVPYAVRNLQITASPSDAANAMVVNNVPMVDGVPNTVTVGYNGPNGYAIRVTASNGVEKIYIVSVTRDAPSDNAEMTALSLSEGTLSPAFDPAGTAFTAQVPYLTTSVQVTGALADATAILRVNGVDQTPGVASAPVPIVVGDNAILVTATAEDGVTVTSRTITVTREAPDLDLATLTVSHGTLSPAFDAATTSYTLELPYTTSSIDVAAASVESDWTVEIDGVEAASRTIAVAVGTQTVTVEVIAAYGETRTHTIAVTRAAATPGSLEFDLGFAAGDVAAGATFTVNAAHLLPGSTLTTTAHSTPIVVGTPLVGAAGTLSWQGALPASLGAGAHRLVVDATSEDGSAVTRTVWFTIMRDGTIGAISLAGPVAYNEPALASTGADGVGELALAAFALLLAGGALLGARRLRRRAA